MTKKIYKSKKNIDYLELVFEWNPQQIELLNNNPDIIIKSIYNPSTNKTTYEINDIFTMVEAPPKGIIKGRTYIKILNPRLYSDHLNQVIEFIKSTLSIKFLSINRIDFCLDIKDEDIFRDIDFNNLNEYKTNGDIFLFSEANGDEGKSLYFNTIDLNKQKRKSVFKKQRVSAILYTKSNLLDRGAKKKREYQNENGDLLTRLELRLNKTPQETKDTHLIRTLSYYLWNDPLYFKNHKETIIQYIFNHYKSVYYLERGDEPIINYSDLYDDDFDFIYINDFINDFINERTEFNIKHNEYKKTKAPAPTYSKKTYKKKLEAINDLLGDKWIEIMSDSLIIQILKDSGIKWTDELEYIKINDNETINGRNIKREIHEYIIKQSRVLLVDELKELNMDDDELYKLFD